MYSQLVREIDVKKMRLENSLSSFSLPVGCSSLCPPSSGWIFNARSSPRWLFTSGLGPTSSVLLWNKPHRSGVSCWSARVAIVSIPVLVTA